MATENSGELMTNTFECKCCCVVKASRVTDLTEFYSEERRRRSTLSDSEEPNSFDDNIIYASSLPPEWTVNVTSENTLQLTLTKTSLEILMELQKV